MKLVGLHNIQVSNDGASDVPDEHAARQERTARLEKILAEYQSKGMSFDTAWQLAQVEHKDIFAAMTRPAGRDGRTIARGNF